LSVRRRWTVAWLGGSVLGIANGTIRETTYKGRVGERTADQLSALTLVAMLALYFRALQRRWPIETSGEAARIGAIWTALTVAFEFGFGHYVDRKSWTALAGNYDPRSGNLWLLVLVWVAVGPAASRRRPARARRPPRPAASP
jgi:hypothetical protein